MGESTRSTWYDRIFSWVPLPGTGIENDVHNYAYRSETPERVEMAIETSLTPSKAMIKRGTTIRNRRSRSQIIHSEEKIPPDRSIFNYFHPWRNTDFQNVVDNLPNETVRVIFHAAIHGDSKHCDMILSNPENSKWINESDSFGRRALHFACAFGHADVTQKLITLGADPNALDNSGSITPLICAAFRGDEDIMNLLLANDVDINYGLDIDDLKQSNPLEYAKHQITTHTALMWAVKTRNIGSVKYLLKKGAKLTCCKMNQKTALHGAAYFGYADILKLLILNEKGSTHALDLKGGNSQNTALHTSIEEGHTSCIELFLSSGANPNSQNYVGQTPLHFAAKTKDLEAMQLLIDAGAEVDMQDYNRKTALQLCVPVTRHAFTGDAISQCMEVLLNNEADVDIQDENGYTVLMLAVDNKLSSVVPILLQHGADLTLCSQSGQTALEMLVKKMPHAIRYVKESLDLAIKVAKKDTTDPRCKVALDFRAIIPTVEKRNSKAIAFRKETELLLSFCSTGHQDMLSHPLIEAFLILKWQRVNKYFYFCFLANLLMVSMYSTFLVQLYSQKCPLMKSCLGYNASDCNHIHSTMSSPKILSYDMVILWWILMIVIIAFCIKEVFQMLLLSPKRYFAFAENYVQIAFGVISIWNIIPIIFIKLRGENSCSCQDLTCKDYALASIGIILAWLLILLRIGKFPSLGNYVHMLFKVVKNFGLFVSAYACILVAFSLSMGILFNEEHSNVFQSILSILVMMTGEISISFSSNYNDTVSESFPKVWIGDLSSLIFNARYVLFCLFVLFVTIVLMNLLVGLAVSDIQVPVLARGLQNGANLDRLKRLVYAISQLETMFATKLAYLLPQQWRIRMRQWALLVPRENMYVCYFQPYNPADVRLPQTLQLEALHIVEKREDARRTSKGITDFEIKKLLDKVEIVEGLLKSLIEECGGKEKPNTLQVNSLFPNK